MSKDKIDKFKKRMAIAGISGLVAVSGCGQTSSNEYKSTNTRYEVKTQKDSISEYDEMHFLNMIINGSTEISDEDKKRFVNILDNKYHDELSKESKKVCDTIRKNPETIDINSTEFKMVINEFYEILEDKDKDILNYPSK